MAKDVDRFAISEKQNIFATGASRDLGDLPVGQIC
jgi:hypothetical protein